MENEKTIGELIREKRKELKLSQRELAEKTGLALGTIQQYEYGTREPSLNSILKLVEAFDIDLDYFQVNELFNTLKSPTIYLNVLGLENKKTDFIQLEPIFFKLNKRGRNEAIKRISELTRLAEYTLPIDD